MTAESKKQVIEPDEVLPPAPSTGRRKSAGQDPWKMWMRTFGPLVLGMVVDVVDFGTRIPGPNAFMVGMVATFLMMSLYGLPMRKRIIMAGLAGLYCMIPMTGKMPLATLMGVYAKFAGKRR